MGRGGMVWSGGWVGMGGGQFGGIEPPPPVLTLPSSASSISGGLAAAPGGFKGEEFVQQTPNFCKNETGDNTRIYSAYLIKKPQSINNIF